MPECVEDWEDHKWTPTAVQDGDLIMYLRAARSMAAFVGMCDGGSTEDGAAAASMDETTINSLDMLHHFNYDTGSALQALVKTINPKSMEKRWSEEDAKKFAKGIRLYGKNFFRIRKELLPTHETGQLVEYYYFWKKTPAAANTRPHRRHRRSNLRRPARTPRPPSGEYLSSASEVSDNDSDDSDSRELSGYACGHCYTTKSKDWHHAGKENALLCTECRLFFKKYGEERPIDPNAEPPPFMFKPVKQDQQDLRDRNNQTEDPDKKETSSTPDSIDSVLDGKEDDRKSPSVASESSLCSSDNKSKTSKRSVVDSDGEESVDLKCKRHKDRDGSESLSESFSDSDSVYGNDNEDNDDDNEDNDDENDDADENNQDDLSSIASSTTPSPHLESDTEDLKPLTTYLKPPRTNTVDIQTDLKTAASEEDEEEDEDSDNSDSDSGSDSEESGSGQQEESTEESTRPSSEAQSSTDEPNQAPPPPHELIVNIKTEIKTEPVDEELLSIDHHIPQDGPEPIDIKPVLGVPPDFYPAVHSNPEHTDCASPSARASPLCSGSGGPNPLATASMSVTLSSSTSVTTSRPASPGQEKGLPPAGLTGLPPHMLAAQLGPFAPPHQGLLPHHFLGSHHQGPLHAPPPLVPAHGSLSSSLMHSGLPLSEHMSMTDSINLAHSEHHRPHSPVTVSPGQGHLPSEAPMSRSTPPMPPHMVPRSPTHHMGPRSPSLHMTPRSPQLHMVPRSPPSHMGSRSPHRLSRTPPPHAIPMARVPPLSSHRSPSPLRSHSPGPLKQSSRPPSRSRSRSPLIRDQSDSEPESPRSPSPEARIMNEECYRTKTAIFIKHWFRGRNTCSRCDFEFRPYADSKLARKREERPRKISISSSNNPPPREERKDERDTSRDRERELERVRDRERERDPDIDRIIKEEDLIKKTGTPPENRSADAQITSALMAHQQIPPYAIERHTPRGPFPPGHDPTPALRTLSEYARPHALSAQDPGRGMPYNLSNLPPHAIDPYYRMASMYPPGSRERLELELERDKRERDERERQLRERELREMELREKMKHEMDLKPPGFDRMPPPGHLDPHFMELQRRMASLPPGAHPQGNSHIPGVYPPASLATDLIHRERELRDRLEPIRTSIPVSTPSIAAAAAVAQHNQRNAALYEIYHRSYSQEQLAMLQRQVGSAGLLGLPPGALSAKSPSEHDLIRMGADPAVLAHYFSRAEQLAASGMGPHIQPQSLPPGHPLLAPAREQEILYRELLNRPPYNSDPVLAHQLTQQHEAIQRHLAMERERLGGGGPHMH